MPRFDGTGPRGTGPMTGRGMGFCGRGSGMGYGRGMGFGRGAGRGFGRGYGMGFVQEPVALTEAEEKRILETQLKEIEAEKAAIQKRIAELK